MAEGRLLKSHRDLEGHKVFQLHSLDGRPIPIEPVVVEYLCEHGLIDSNKKFPTATYWLTAKARRLVPVEPLGVHSKNAAPGDSTSRNNV